jgi:hypothetical protein
LQKEDEDDDSIVFIIMLTQAVREQNMNDAIA